MPDYLLPCSCGQKIRIVSAQAGGNVSCACGKSLSVPTLRGLRDLDTAPPIPDTNTRPRWNRTQGLTFVLGLLIAAVGLYYVAYYSWRYAQLTVQGSHFFVDRTDDAVKFLSAEVSTMSPVAMFDEWAKTKEEGLGEPTKPIWVTAKETIARYVFRIQAGAITLAAGVILSVIALFLGRLTAAPTRRSCLRRPVTPINHQRS